ncbi:MAG: transcriptional regulator [Alphaproteobacteria bacterium]|nr:MAG: transcriptional regulator [Alphaproteobacteria bacterium]
MAKQPKKKRLIVSSRHLATNETWPLSEVEFGLTVVNNAFQKWIVKCATAAGQPELNALDVLVFHNINHRGSAKRRIDVCFVLNIEDSHTVNYALKKLLKLGLIEGTKRGKEIFYTPTDKGRNFCDEYKTVREQCLISGYNSYESKNSEELSFIAETLRSLSGLYDQAARTAASL